MDRTRPLTMEEIQPGKHIVWRTMPVVVRKVLKHVVDLRIEETGQTVRVRLSSLLGTAPIDEDTECGL